MRTTRCKLDMHSEVTRRNNDRDVAHAEWLFQLNHLPERYEQIKRMNPKPGHEAEYAAILARYEEECKA